jgi:hypothetical protein
VGLELFSDGWWAEAVGLLEAFLRAECRRHVFAVSEADQGSRERTGVVVAVVRLLETAPAAPAAVAEASAGQEDGYSPKVNLTGLTQNSQVDPAV